MEGRPNRKTKAAPRFQLKFFWRGVGRGLSQRQRQRQRERRQTKSLMSRTMAAHVRYNSWYISLPSSAKQEREMTKFCVPRNVNLDG